MRFVLDHEPLNSSAKMAPFADTLSGFTAFDTYIPFGIQLIQEGLFSPLEWVEKVTLHLRVWQKCKVVGNRKRVGSSVDPEVEWTLNKETIVSQGKIRL